MRFTRIRISNWRNFLSAEVGLEPRVFIVGPNASGKSNLLDVFAFLRDIGSVVGGFQGAVLQRGGVPRVRCLAARGTSSQVGIEVDIGNDEEPAIWSYELVFTSEQRGRRRPILKSEVVKRHGRVIAERPDKHDEGDPELLTQTSLEQTARNRDFRQVAEFFASVQYRHLVPQLVREPDRSVGKTNDPFGGDFLERVARTNKKTRDSRLRKINRALQVAVPQLDELKIEPDESGTWHLKGRYQHWRPKGAWHDETDFSDGTLRLLGLLWVLLESGGPLLLEEPELSLHPAVIRKLPQIFSRLQGHGGRQVLVSTHSPDLLIDQGIGLNEVLLLSPRSEGTEVVSAGTFDRISKLLESGVPLPEVVLPHTRPADVEQLPLFAD